MLLHFDSLLLACCAILPVFGHMLPTEPLGMFHFVKCFVYLQVYIVICAKFFDFHCSYLAVSYFSEVLGLNLDWHSGLPNRHTWGTFFSQKRWVQSWDQIGFDCYLLYYTKQIWVTLKTWIGWELILSVWQFWKTALVNLISLVVVTIKNYFLILLSRV